MAVPVKTWEPQVNKSCAKLALAVPVKTWGPQVNKGSGQDTRYWAREQGIGLGDKVLG